MDPAAVARFFAGDLGRQLRGSRNLHREYPFSVLTEARRFFPQAPAGEEVLHQGVIDCWFETAEGITLVDFKTDHGLRRASGPAEPAVPGADGSLRLCPGGSDRNPGCPAGTLVFGPQPWGGAVLNPRKKPNNSEKKSCIFALKVVSCIMRL